MPNEFKISYGQDQGPSIHYQNIGAMVFADHPDMLKKYQKRGFSHAIERKRTKGNKLRLSQGFVAVTDVKDLLLELQQTPLGEYKKVVNDFPWGELYAEAIKGFKKYNENQLVAVTNSLSREVKIFEDDCDESMTK